MKYPAYFHLWFLYAIISVYLMMPLLRLIAKNTHITIYALCMWFSWFSVLPFIQSYGYLTGNVFFILKLDVISLWAGFALLGFFLQEHSIRLKLRYGILLMIGGLFSTILLTYMASKDGVPKEIYQSYFMPNIIVMSSGVYISLLKCKSPPAVSTVISKYSFGVYLCHMLVMPFVWRLISNENVVKHGATLAILSSVTTFLICLLICRIITNIPFLRRVI